MMIVHESGHALAAVWTGGTVRRVVWHPAVISRTDVQPNPHPLAEVWAGPLVGSLAPLIIALLSSALRLRVAYLIWTFAGFCLLANGAYIGIGSIDPIGDAHELLAHGMPRWPMAVFGIAAVAAGMWMWHRVSPRFGFGTSPLPINARHTYGTLGLAAIARSLRSHLAIEAAKRHGLPGATTPAPGTPGEGGGGGFWQRTAGKSPLPQPSPGVPGAGEMPRNRATNPRRDRVLPDRRFHSVFIRPRLPSPRVPGEERKREFLRHCGSAPRRNTSPRSRRVPFLL